MIAHLGELLRVMLETASHEVALAEELALTETYLAIEHARLDARLLRHAGGAGVVLSRQPLAEKRHSPRHPGRCVGMTAGRRRSCGAACCRNRAFAARTLTRLQGQLDPAGFLRMHPRIG